MNVAATRAHSHTQMPCDGEGRYIYKYVYYLYLKIGVIETSSRMNDRGGVWICRSMRREIENSAIRK